PRSGATVQELAAAHARPMVGIQDLRRGVPDALVRLVHEMLEPDPQRRPSGMHNVLWRLRGLTGLAPIVGDPPPPRVLIVDDDESIRRILGFYVTRALGEVDL